jgi:pyruvate carboxylase subunit B
MSPISGGTAGPPTESLVQAFKGTEWDTGYDIGLLMEIRDYFLKIWSKYRHLHRMEAIRPDPSVTVHQIPGGMLSNLVSQLEQQGAGDKYLEVLKETPRVRAELGYPPLVTPTSQVVGVQAVMNVLFGRYKNIPNETKEYARGMYGRPPAEISPEIYEKVLGPGWKDEVIDVRPADLLEPQWGKYEDMLKEQDLLKKPEDVLTVAIYPQVGLKFLKGEAAPEFTSDQLPLSIDHPFTKSYVKAQFPEVEMKDLNFGDIAATQVGGPAPIPTQFDVMVNGEPFEVEVKPTGGYIISEGGTAPAQSGPPKDVEGGLASPMQGTVLKVRVEKGASVSEGDVVVILEAMKMEQEVAADRSGEVKEIYVSEGDAVTPGDVLLQIL